MTIEEREGLPEGWAETTLGEISDVQGGVTKDSKNQSDKDEEFPYLRVANVQRGYLDLNEIKTIRIPAVRAETMLLKPGDILFNEGGDADKLGRGWVWEGQIDRCSFQNHVFRARLYDTDLQPKYISRWSNSRGLEFFLRNGKQTTNLASINRSTLVQLPISLPPFAEQIRIIDKLNALLARVDAGRERLERVPKLVKRFRQSVLSAAVSGELTREWRGDGDAEWEEVELRDCASDFSYGSSSKSDKFGAVPVLRMGNIQSGNLDWSDLVYTSDPEEIEKYDLKPGNILFNRTNSPELVGKTTIYRGERQAIYAGYLIRVTCGPSLLPDYLNYCLNSQNGRDYCWQVKTDGVSQSNINAQKLRDFPFLLPTLPEQAEIVRRVEALFTMADRLEARAQAALARYSRLTPALLAKAFRGELVPQDPADEPASVLLERIRAQRETAGSVKKAAGRGRKPGTTTPRAEDGAGVGEPQSEPKRGRGRPRKVQEGAGQTSRGTPVAASAEEAIWLLEERARAEREGKVTVQAGLFGD